MFKEETKKALFDIFTSKKRIDDELTSIKIAMHDLEKLGHDTTALEKALNEVGIAFYQFKIKSVEYQNEKLHDTI